MILALLPFPISSAHSSAKYNLYICILVKGETMKINIFATCFVICCLTTTFQVNSYAQADVSNFVEVSRLGNGVINAIAVSPDGTMTAIAGGLDISIYRLPSLELVQRLETQSSASYIEWLDNGNRLGSLHSDN